MKIANQPQSQQDKEEEISDTGDGSSKAKFLKKKILTCGIAGFILLSGGLGASAYWGLISIPFLQKKSEVVKVSSPLIGPSLKLAPLVINLREENKRHFLKVTIVLEIGKPEWLEEIKKKTPLLADLAILTLCDKRLEDLDQQNSKENIKRELLGIIDQSLVGGKVKKIYFDEFLYQ
jgi:flagellar FliL protein